MLNFTLYENGNGGQLILANNEILHTRSLATLAYLKMFGGSVEANTVIDNPEASLRFDWWGNDPAQNSGSWINSNTERTLQGIPLNTANLFVIKKAVEKDVEILKKYGDVTVSVTYPEINQVKIVVTITEQPNEASSLAIIWDASRNEVVQKNII
jgi:hypothetical protein